MISEEVLHVSTDITRAKAVGTVTESVTAVSRNTVECSSVVWSRPELANADKNWYRFDNAARVRRLRHRGGRKNLNKCTVFITKITLSKNYPTIKHVKYVY